MGHLLEVAIEIGAHIADSAKAKGGGGRMRVFIRLLKYAAITIASLIALVALLLLDTAITKVVLINQTSKELADVTIDVRGFPACAARRYRICVCVCL